jgi:glyoxylase-like metal-dependent hydrolase (beta-lactamase superfamily II)
MKLIPLPAFSDNYIWMLHDGQAAWVVDPGDAQPVLNALATEGLQLQGILVTHHHPDHTGGVDLLRERTGAAVFGPARETVPEPLQRLQQGDQRIQQGQARLAQTAEYQQQVLALRRENRSDAEIRDIVIGRSTLRFAPCAPVSTSR